MSVAIERRRCIRRCPRPICGSGKPTMRCMRRAARRCWLTPVRSKIAFKPDRARISGSIEQAIDRAKADDRVLVLGLHGGRAENGELQAICELRGVAFTGSGSASSNLAFDKVAAKRFAAIAASTRLSASRSPTSRRRCGAWQADRQAGTRWFELRADLRQFQAGYRRRSQRREAPRNIVIEPFIAGIEATCGVLERADGSVIALPPIEIVPAEGGRLRLHVRNISRKRPRKSVPAASHPRSAPRSWTWPCAPIALCPARLFPHRFHRLRQGAGLSRDQHPAGPDQGLALPEGTEGARHRFRRFPERSD